MSRDSPSTGWKGVCEEMGVSTDYDAKPECGDLVRACPSCDNTRLNERVQKRPRYLCTECRAEFNAPTKREPKHLAERIRRMRT